jgi:putative phosphoesterase
MPSQRTTVLIVSDSHGYLDPRLADLSRRCDIAVHAGDIMSGEVLEALRPRSGEVIAVRGNNDVAHKWQDNRRAALAGLPEQQLVDLPGGRLAVEHGHRIWDARNTHARLRRKYRHARAIVYGHTHKRVCDTGADPWVLNPGASGRIRNHGGPSCLVLTASRRHWRLQELAFAAGSGAGCTS